MAVYLDNMCACYGKLAMCHMIADTEDELHAMAARIGVDRHQFHAASLYGAHYDVDGHQREQAIKGGAHAITWRQAAAMTLRRRTLGDLGYPTDALDWLRVHQQQPQFASAMK